jgi:hypothetical protein
VKRTLAILFLAALVVGGHAESLTGPDFKGYLSGKGLAKGDTLFVEIDTTSKLAFKAVASDSRTFTLEFSGGETGNLFSFLPAGRTAADRGSSGGQELSLRGRVPVTVQDVDAAGRALVRGSRTIAIEGRAESIEIDGWVNPRDVGSDRVVAFSRVADARLVYRSLLSSARDVLTAEDIRRVLAAGTAVTSTAAAAAAGTTAAATGAPAAGPAGSATGADAAATAPTAPSTTLALTDEKKLELLLVYLNRLVDLVFGR